MTEKGKGGRCESEGEGGRVASRFLNLHVATELRLG